MPHMPETFQTKCPLCGGLDTKIKWLVDCSGANYYNPAFNPLRTWRYCPTCHHVFAGNYPQDLNAAVTGFTDPQYMFPKPQLFPMYSDILHRIGVTGVQSILDVGFGAGELLLVANEMGLECWGIDIRKTYVDNLKYLLPEADLFCGTDAMKGPFDIVVLGDVLEHVVDPTAMVRQVHGILSDYGRLWISTPNFDSAFAVTAGDKDPMRGVCEHMQWFSRKSLHKLLREEGFEPVDYNVSKHFGGCMEVKAVKKG